MEPILIVILLFLIVDLLLAAGTLILFAVLLDKLLKIEKKVGPLIDSLSG